MAFIRSGEPGPIPPKFWKSLTMEEFRSVVEKGYLDRKLSKRLWRICEYSTPVPDRVIVEVNAADLMRVFPPKE